MKFLPSLSPVLRYGLFLCLMFSTISSFLYAQTITGTVFFDGNNNGSKDATEVGFGGVVVNAYATSATPVATTTSALTGTLGTYTLSGLTSGQTYRLEFMVPAGYNNGAYSATSKTSVQFVQAGAANADFGVYVPGQCLPDKTIKIVSGCAALPLISSTISLVSWDYNSCVPTLARYTSTPHTEDANASQTGIPLGMTTQKIKGVNRVIFTTVSAPISSVFPEAPDGKSALYMADYSGTGITFSGYKLLTKLSALSPSIDVSHQFPAATNLNFGEYGLGGLDISDDNKWLYVVNMGNGKIIKLDVSTVDYASIPSGGYTNLPVSEITIPTTVSNCTNGRFRPSAIEYHAGDVYIAGVCDASQSSTKSSSDLRLKVIKMNEAGTSFMEVLNVDLSTFRAGNLGSVTGSGPQPGWEQVKWYDTFQGGDALGNWGCYGCGRGEVQPVVNDISFDDTGSPIIGVASRKVFSTDSNSDTGYLIRTWRKNDGTFELENTGVSGPYTSQARPGSVNYAVETPGNYDNIVGGPGGKWFFEQGLINIGGDNNGHPYLYTGGTYVVLSTQRVLAGFVDPLNFQQTGARYFNWKTGVTDCATSVTGFKLFAITGTEGVCEMAPIEIGNRVWKDTNNNGIQDPDEPGLVGVTVTICVKGSTTPIATAITDANGDYIFSTATGTSDNSFKYGLNLNFNTEYDIKVTALGSDPSVTGLSLSQISPSMGETLGSINTGMTLANSDGFLVSGLPTATIKVGSPGQNNHSYDFGFSTGCVKPDAGKDSTIVCALGGSLPTSFDLKDAVSGQKWKIIAPVPAGASINITTPTGNVTGTIVAGIYKFRLQTQTDSVTCADTVQITVEACACVKPNAGADQMLTCGLNGAPSTADLTDAAVGQKWKVLSVQPNTTVSVTTPAGAVTGMTASGTYRFVLQTQSDSLACRDTVSVIVPDCTCPTVNVLTPNATVCKDSLWPTLTIAIVGSNTQGVGAAWYANPTGGSSLGTGVSFKPAGTAAVTDTFYVQLTGVTSNCQQNPRTAVIVTVQNCTVEVDLALKKLINKKIAQIGDELTYTIKVFNQLNVAATGVEVKDTIATSVQFVANSFSASRGSASISGNVITWTIGNIAANAGMNGDTVTLTYKVKATQVGLHFNTAEISKTNEKDIDSTPSNGKDQEDDLDRQCFTVPVKLCPNEKVQVRVPAQYTGLKWFKGTQELTALAGQNVVLLDEVGQYTYTATNGSCPASGCCPVIIEESTNCCPVQLCVPVTVKILK